MSKKSISLLNTGELKKMCSEHNVVPSGDKRFKSEWVKLTELLNASTQHNRNEIYRKTLTNILTEARDDAHISYEFSVLVESLGRLINPGSNQDALSGFSLSKVLGGGKSGDLVLVVNRNNGSRCAQILKIFVTSPSKVSLEVVLHRRINNLLNASYLPNMMPGISTSGYISSDDLKVFLGKERKLFPKAVKGSSNSYPFLIMESFEESAPLEDYTEAGGKIFLTGTLSQVVRSLCGKFNMVSRPDSKIENFLKAVLWQLAFIVFKLNVNNIQHCDLQTNNIMLRTLDEEGKDTNDTWLGIPYSIEGSLHYVSVGIIDAGLSTEDSPCKKLRKLSSSIKEDLKVCHLSARLLAEKALEIVSGELSRSGSTDVDDNFYQNIMLIFEVGGLIRNEDEMDKTLQILTLQRLKAFLKKRREPCMRHCIHILSNPFANFGDYVEGCQCSDTE
jgi:hypothetical protein